MTEAMNIATIMDFPDDEKYNLMCMIWMKRVQRHAPGARVRVLTVGGLPFGVQQYFERYSNVSVEKALRQNIGEFDHFNLSVKLFNLSRIQEPFIFLDADMFVLSDLGYLWNRRDDKPFIGVYDPLFSGQGRSPFRNLNSGLQIVSDPAFYNYEAVVECSRRNGHRFATRGDDQMLLSDYFHSIGYDFTHPEVGAGWNSCSRFTRLFKTAPGEWRGVTRDQSEPCEIEAHIVHYWNGACRPWNMDCPLFFEEVSRLREEGVNAAPVRRVIASVGDERPVLRVHVLNAPPDILTQPGEHPFFPVRDAGIEPVDSADDADVIFWRLDPSSPGADYDKLVGRCSAFFKAHEDRFVLYSAVRNPGWFYLNHATCFTPHAVLGRDKNRLARVISVPYMLDCTDFTLISDEGFIEELRGEQKRYDVLCMSSVAALVKSGLKAEDTPGLRTLQLARNELMALPAGKRRDIMREALREMARSKYYVHVESDSTSPLLLGQAMMIGTVPVVVGAPDLPFSEAVRWQDFAVFPILGKTLSQIFRSLETHYAARRQKAMEFWRDYCEPSACNDQIIRRYLHQKCHAAGR